MNTEKHSRTGLTLVEVIVVAAIIILVIGFAVPGIVSLTSLGRGDFGNSARNLYGALRSSKMYASTHRATAATVYFADDVYDSITNDPVRVVEGFALARRAVDRSEALKLAQAWMNDGAFGGNLEDTDGNPVPAPDQLDYLADFFLSEGDFGSDRPIFFLLQNPEGQFREFGRDAVILNAFPSAGDPTPQSAITELRGFLNVQVMDFANWLDDDDDDYPDPISPAPKAMPQIADIVDDPMDVMHPNTYFLAHVFAPTGRALMGGTAAERVILEVGPSPSLADAYRFSRELTTTEVSTTDADESGEPLAQAEIGAGRRFLSPVLIELYQSTGRVKASDGV